MSPLRERRVPRISTLDLPVSIGVYGGTTPAFELWVDRPIVASGWGSWARLTAPAGRLMPGMYWAHSSAYAADIAWADLLLYTIDRDLPVTATHISWRWGRHYHGVGEFEAAPNLAEARRRQARYDAGPVDS